jgi:hypothetical protein
VNTIVMRHPTLPERQEIEVPRDAMPHYTAAGWQRVPAEELEKRAALKAKADAEARAAEEAADAKPEEQPADEPDASEESEPEEAPTRPARSRTRATKKDEEN